ncbi:MAG: hypothetical protein V1754_03430 [Pseudomonadota bacterium]
MWDRFDANAVRMELRQMRSIGLNTCRSFAFIPSLMPKTAMISQTVAKRMDNYLQICSDEDIATIPSFLVGHMSGENYDFIGQKGRSPYTDPEVLKWQKQIVHAIGKIGAKHPAVIAYLVSNEMPLWGGRNTPPTIHSWAEALRQSLHEVDHEHPFGIGDGVMNLKGGQNGFDVHQIADLIDFVGPHTYYSDSDPRRQSLNAEFCIRCLTHLGMPTLLEEFGCSSCQVSEENQALYFREVIHGCLTSGAAGALGWCYSDFDLVDEPPYQHHAFELGFGITRADGSEKPVCEELRGISQLIDRIDFPSLTTPQPKAAIIVPSYFNIDYPFSWENRDRMRRTLLQSYVLCVGAGIETELVPEQSDLSGYRLVLVPSTQKLLAPTWRFLLEHEEKGNPVYWSYFSGDYNFHQGAWCQNFAELTGCTHKLRYACYDLPATQHFLTGSGLKMSVKTSVGSPYSRSYLPLQPIEALNTQILATDKDGQPSLTLVQRGQGQVIFLNCPWEYYLGEQVEINVGDNSFSLYQLISEKALQKPALSCNHPGVQTRLLQSSGGPLIWVINHDWQEVVAKLDTPGGIPIYGTSEPLAEGIQSLRLKPKEVFVYRVK